MAKYSVSIPFHATYHVEVEADSKEQAEEKAIEDAYPSICNYCSRDGLELDEMNHEAEIYTQEI